MREDFRGCDIILAYYTCRSFLFGMSRCAPLLGSNRNQSVSFICPKISGRIISRKSVGPVILNG